MLQVTEQQGRTSARLNQIVERLLSVEEGADAISEGHSTTAEGNNATLDQVVNQPITTVAFCIIEWSLAPMLYHCLQVFPGLEALVAAGLILYCVSIYCYMVFLLVRQNFPGCERFRLVKTYEK